MKALFICILMTAGLFGQTTTATPATTPAAAPTPGLTTTTNTPLGTTAAAMASMTLPTYLAAGGAYNQFTGPNAWASGIFPISTPAGLLMSTTVDIFPVKTVTAGKTAYIFTTSARAGVHRYIHHGAKDSILAGADAGFSWAQAAAAGSTTSGVSAAVTITYVHQFNATWGAMFPVRAIYMPTLGGWNPIVEGGIVWTPGGK